MSRAIPNTVTFRLHCISLVIPITLPEIRGDMKLRNPIKQLLGPRYLQTQIGNCKRPTVTVILHQVSLLTLVPLAVIWSPPGICICSPETIGCGWVSEKCFCSVAINCRQKQGIVTVMTGAVDEAETKPMLLLSSSHLLLYRLPGTQAA